MADLQKVMFLQQSIVFKGHGQIGFTSSMLIIPFNCYVKELYDYIMSTTANDFTSIDTTKTNLNSPHLFAAKARTSPSASIYTTCSTGSGSRCCMDHKCYVKPSNFI
jgi:hypothetical protein